MKTLFVNLLLFVCFALNAQSYYFNRLIQYEENGTNQIQVCFNTNNMDYFLLLKNQPDGISAQIYDHSTQQIHHYEVEPVEDEDVLFYDYSYKSSEKMSRSQDLQSTNNFDFEPTWDDDYYAKGDLKVLVKESSQDPAVTAELTVRHTHEDLFPAFNLCCLRRAQQFQTEGLKEKYVVVMAKIMDQNGMDRTYKLIDDQVINYRMNIPTDKK